jgi:hypothetical protein
LPKSACPLYESWSDAAVEAAGVDETVNKIMELLNL